MINEIERLEDSIRAGKECMMASCIQCGSRIPDNQGSRSCSMCYGDIDHGKDGYYRAEMERAEQEQRERQRDYYEREQESVEE